jgi:hypothetical protein
MVATVRFDFTSRYAARVYAAGAYDAKWQRKMEKRTDDSATV